MAKKKSEAAAAPVAASDKPKHAWNSTVAETEEALHTNLKTGTSAIYHWGRY
jgi:hypothetical protein